MKPTPAALALLILVPAAAAVASDDGASWSEVRAETPLAGAPGVAETVWTTPRPPGGRFDVIELHRYRGSGPARATLLYLPGTNMNGEVALTDERYNLWLYLARRGVDVFALDYRTRQVPPEGELDLGFMAEWSLERFVGDARAAASLARRETGRNAIFVAGFSRGVSLAWLLAASSPDPGLAGLIALDGGLKSHAPKQAGGFEAARTAFLEQGSFASDVAGGMGWAGRAALMEETLQAPQAAAGEGDETRGQRLARILFDAWTSFRGPGALSNAPSGVSRPEVLARLLAGYDRYYPALQNLEGSRIADYPDAPFTDLDDGWGELTLPILYFGTTRMGSDWILDGVYTAVESGSSDVTLHVLEDHGHLDLLVGERSAEEVFQPIADWLMAHAGETAP